MNKGTPIKTRYTCSATGPNQKTAWWMLSFSFMYFFTKTKIYYRENSAYRLAGFPVYITNTTTITNPPTGHLCYRHKGPQLPELYQEIDCHYLGRNIVIYNNRTEGLDQYYKISPTALLELCGVKVFGCGKGFYGENCNKTCRENCLGDHCFPENNTCVWGCNWKRCMNELCNKHYGTCTEGCVPGITGPSCKSASSTTTARMVTISTTATTVIRSTLHVAAESVLDSNETYFNYDTLIIAVCTTVGVVVWSIVFICILRRKHCLNRNNNDTTADIQTQQQPYHRHLQPEQVVNNPTYENIRSRNSYSDFTSVVDYSFNEIRRSNMDYPTANNHQYVNVSYDPNLEPVRTDPRRMKDITKNQHQTEPKTIGSSTR